MKNYIAILCLLLAYLSHAQNVELPWELERLHYQAQTDYELRYSELDTYDLFSAYYRIYKYRRSFEPDAYSLPANEEQEKIKEAISKSKPFEEIDHLINFLESGKLIHLELLAESEPVFAESYPYRLIAAFISDNQQQTQKYLNLLDQHEMISPVLKSFGLNAIGSGTNKVFITQGIQDLIGVLWALDQKQIIGNSVVYNDYTNPISKEYDGMEEFLDEYPNAWVSPTVNLSFLENNIKFIQISGIGFKRSNNEEYSEFAEWQWTNANFSGLGIIPANPADRGIIASYHYFLELLVNNKSNNLEFADFEEKLSAYIKEFGGPR